MFFYAIFTTAAIWFILFRVHGTKHNRVGIREPARSRCKYTDPRNAYGSARTMINLTTLRGIDELVNRSTVSLSCYLPAHSNTEHKLIIILPYRQRQLDLLAFLLYMIPYVRQRKMNTEFIVAEQIDGKLFNRAKLFNAALKEIFLVSETDRKNRLADASCFALHDVDKLPVSPHAPYSCKSGPHQLLRIRSYPEGSHA